MAQLLDCENNCMFDCVLYSHLGALSLTPLQTMGHCSTNTFIKIEKETLNVIYRTLTPNRLGIQFDRVILDQSAVVDLIFFFWSTRHF